MRAHYSILHFSARWPLCHVDIETVHNYRTILAPLPVVKSALDLSSRFVAYGFRLELRLIWVSWQSCGAPSSGEWLLSNTIKGIRDLERKAITCITWHEVLACKINRYTWAHSSHFNHKHLMSSKKCTGYRRNAPVCYAVLVAANIQAALYRRSAWQTSIILRVGLT
jgi:hypothetical protein